MSPIKLNGDSVKALLDTGAMVNTMTPSYCKTRDLPVYPVADLDNVSDKKGIDLVGIGGTDKTPTHFTVARVQTDDIAGYDEEQVFLLVADNSSWALKVPVILGTPTISRMINVLKEGEMENLQGAYLQSYVCRLLAKHGVLDTPELVCSNIANKELDPMKLNEILVVRDKYVIPKFQSMVINGRMDLMLTGYRMNAMVTAPKEGEGTCIYGLQVVNTYVEIRNGSHVVPFVVRNTTDKDIVVSRGSKISKVVAANYVPAPTILAESVEEMDLPKDLDENKLSIPDRKSKLLKELKLEGLNSWPVEKAAAAKELLEEYHDIFALEPFELGCTSQIEHEIHLTDPVPFKERFRKIPPGMMDEVRKSLREMVETGAIRPSNSPWCNAVVLVRKKDGSLRFCVDFRRLNAKTVKNSHPLPRITTVLEKLQGAGHYSALDLKWGFWQVKMAEWAKKYTAFTVGHLGFWEFNRMPFGLCNAPSTFQSVMLNTLGELHMTCCIIYLDDVMVFSKEDDDHLMDLRKCFDRLRGDNLKLKPSKCQFFLREIDYLAHHVSKDGIRPSRANVQPILDFPVPTTYTEIRAFLGLAGHFRRFIEKFTRIARPLAKYLKGEGANKKTDKVSISKRAGRAFNRLKYKLVSRPVLCLPDYSKPFRLETDASKFGLGAVLMQLQEHDKKYHPVAYGSRTVKDSESRYHSSKLEFLALKWAVTEQFKDMLYGNEFEVVTDNNPLTYVLTTPNLDATGHRWVSSLAGYTFSLRYRKGSDNKAADALSRCPVESRKIPKDEKFEEVYRFEKDVEIDDGADSDSDTELEAILNTPKDVVDPASDGASEYYCPEDVNEMLEGSRHNAVTARAELVAIASRQQLHVDKNQKVAVKAARHSQLDSINWSQEQAKDPMIETVISWVKGNRKSNLLADLIKINKDEARAYWKKSSSFKLNKGLLYVKGSCKGDPEAVDLFVVPRKHRRSALDGCHRDAGHQGCARTTALLEERFWWPKCKLDVLNAVRKCPVCIKFEAPRVTAPLETITAVCPLDLVHIDFTSMESNPDLKAAPQTKDVLVITDHFTRYSLAFVTKDQKATTVAKILYEKFIAIFGAPARLLSDQGANFSSAVVSELCKTFHIDKLRTSAYHPQCNGQVERFHGTLSRMLGKRFAESDEWISHLPEICQAYNSTRSAITGYSPHYLMFGRRPRIPVDFLFPTVRGTTVSRRVPDFVVELKKRLTTVFREAKAQAADEANRQKRAYDTKSNAILLKPGDKVLVSADAFVGKRKLKNRWGDKVCTVVEQVSKSSPVYLCEDDNGIQKRFHRNRLLLLATPLSSDAADSEQCDSNKGSNIQVCPAKVDTTAGAEADTADPLASGKPSNKLKKQLDEIDEDKDVEMETKSAKEVSQLLAEKGFGLGIGCMRCNLPYFWPWNMGSSYPMKGDG